MALKLTKRKKRFPGDTASEKDIFTSKAYRAFHAPQREHIKQPMPPREKD